MSLQAKVEEPGQQQPVVKQEQDLPTSPDDDQLVHLTERQCERVMFPPRCPVVRTDFSRRPPAVSYAEVERAFLLLDTREVVYKLTNVRSQQPNESNSDQQQQEPEEAFSVVPESALQFGAGTPVFCVPAPGAPPVPAVVLNALVTPEAPDRPLYSVRVVDGWVLHFMCGESVTYRAAAAGVESLAAASPSASLEKGSAPAAEHKQEEEAEEPEAAAAAAAPSSDMAESENEEPADDEVEAELNNANSDNPENPTERFSANSVTSQTEQEKERQEEKNNSPNGENNTGSGTAQGETSDQATETSSASESTLSRGVESRDNNNVAVASPAAARAADSQPSTPPGAQGDATATVAAATSQPTPDSVAMPKLKATESMSSENQHIPRKRSSISSTTPASSGPGSAQKKIKQEETSSADMVQRRFLILPIWMEASFVQGVLDKYKMNLERTCRCQLSLGGGEVESDPVKPLKLYFVVEYRRESDFEKAVDFIEASLLEPMHLTDQRCLFMHDIAYCNPDLYRRHESVSNLVYQRDAFFRNGSSKPWSWMTTVNIPDDLACAAGKRLIIGDRSMGVRMIRGSAANCRVWLVINPRPVVYLSSTSAEEVEECRRRVHERFSWARRSYR